MKLGSQSLGLLAAPALLTLAACSSSDLPPSTIIVTVQPSPGPTAVATPTVAPTTAPTTAPTPTQAAALKSVLMKMSLGRVRGGTCEVRSAVTNEVLGQTPGPAATSDGVCTVRIPAAIGETGEAIILAWKAAPFANPDGTFGPAGEYYSEQQRAFVTPPAGQQLRAILTPPEADGDDDTIDVSAALTPLTEVATRIVEALPPEQRTGDAANQANKTVSDTLAGGLDIVNTQPVLVDDANAGNQPLSGADGDAANYALLIAALETIAASSGTSNDGSEIDRLAAALADDLLDGTFGDDSNEFYDGADVSTSGGQTLKDRLTAALATQSNLADAATQNATNAIKDTVKATPAPTPRVVVTAAPRPSVSPVVDASPRPTVTRTPTATPRPSVAPTATVAPTTAPTATVAPTVAPTVAATPTASPTTPPTPAPTDSGTGGTGGTGGGTDGGT